METLTLDIRFEVLTEFHRTCHATIPLKSDIFVLTYPEALPFLLNYAPKWYVHFWLNDSTDILSFYPYNKIRHVRIWIDVFHIFLFLLMLPPKKVQETLKVESYWMRYECKSKKWEVRIVLIRSVDNDWPLSWKHWSLQGSIKSVLQSSGYWRELSE